MAPRSALLRTLLSDQRAAVSLGVAGVGCYLLAGATKTIPGLVIAATGQGYTDVAFQLVMATEALSVALCCFGLFLNAAGILVGLLRSRSGERRSAWFIGGLVLNSIPCCLAVLGAGAIGLLVLALSQSKGGFIPH